MLVHIWSAILLKANICNILYTTEQCLSNDMSALEYVYVNIISAVGVLVMDGTMLWFEEVHDV